MSAAKGLDEIADDRHGEVEGRTRRLRADRRDARRPAEGACRAPTATMPPGIRPLNRTRPKYVSITMPSVVSPTMGRANVRNRKPSEMNPSAMPASVESSAARGVDLAHPLRDERAGELDHARAECGDQSGLPRDARRVGQPGLRRERLRRQHHQKHVREERHGVDAVRQRADVGASGALGELLRLPRVVDVADENRHRRARQHAAVDQLGWKPQHEPAQGVDEEQLDEVVEREAEKPVDIAADEPTHAGARYHPNGAPAMPSEPRPAKPRRGIAEVRAVGPQRQK